MTLKAIKGNGHAKDKTFPTAVLILLAVWGRCEPQWRHKERFFHASGVWTAKRLDRRAALIDSFLGDATFTGKGDFESLTFVKKGVPSSYCQMVPSAASDTLYKGAYSGSAIVWTTNCEIFLRGRFTLLPFLTFTSLYAPVNIKTYTRASI